MAVADRQDVVLLDPDQASARLAAEQCDALVLHGDIAQGGILEEAGVERADAVVACTSDDSANLMAMSLAAERGVRTLVSVVNESSHRHLFERLGVHALVDPDEALARHLHGVTCQPKAKDVIPLNDGTEALEVVISPGAPLAGKTLAEASESVLPPEGLLVVSVRRDGRVFIPRGSTRIVAGDELLVFSESALTSKQLEVFTS
jgi:trk system potassium uptake protein TrkA